LTILSLYVNKDYCFKVIIKSRLIKEKELIINFQNKFDKLSRKLQGRSHILNKFECHIDITKTPVTITEALSSQCSLSVSEIKKTIDKGALWHSTGKSTQRCRRLKKTLKMGDALHFYYDKQVLEQRPTPAILIHDAVDYSVWYKPYGMLSQGSKWSDHCTITRWAQKNLTPERAVFSVHRLDRAATGLILVAHSKKAARALSAMFEHHNLEKTYQIIVQGDYRQRTLQEIIETPVDGKSARSHFSFLQYQAVNDVSLLAVKIDTGRKHQIRVHAASIGMPVVGDRLHGIVGTPNDKSSLMDLQLCAVKLAFTCPLTGQDVCYELPTELTPTFDVFNDCGI
jgi:tRNA pseudouridine32 synthase/23S rRNA pseudouridine746 synthase